MDALVCPACRELEGHTWILQAGTDPYPNKLVHPIYGHVYDTRPAAEGSLIKEEEGRKCRCTLKHEFHTSEMQTNLNDAPKVAGKKQPSTKIVEQQ